MHTSEAVAITTIRQWSVFGATHHGILADFETATSLESSRVAFCFSFRHSWKTVAQIIQRPTAIHVQSQKSVKKNEPKNRGA
jgi:hypothetical protein